MLQIVYLASLYGGCKRLKKILLVIVLSVMCVVSIPLTTTPAKQEAQGLNSSTVYELASLPVYAKRYVEKQSEIYLLRGKSAERSTVISKSSGKVDNTGAVLEKSLYFDNGYLGQYRTSSGVMNVLCELTSSGVYVYDLYAYKGNESDYEGELPEYITPIIDKYSKLFNSKLRVTDYKECSSSLNGNKEYILLELKTDVAKPLNSYVVVNLEDMSSHLI